MTETLANGYSSESTPRELSNEYQHDRVSMIFKDFCILVLSTNVGSALEGLKLTLQCEKGLPSCTDEPKLYNKRQGKKRNWFCHCFQQLRSYLDEIETRKKEERNCFLCCLQQLRSCRDEIETRNQEEILFSPQIVPRGISYALATT